jgi:hypothetical protein
MATIKLTNKQLQLIQSALDFYSRIGILQLENIIQHPVIEKYIFEKCTEKKTLEVGDSTMRGEIVEIGENYIQTKGTWSNGEEIKTWTDIDKIKLSPDWEKMNEIKKNIEIYLSYIKSFISDTELGLYGSLGIHNKNAEICREAFDIIQVIRHEFWKENSNKNDMTVNSSIHPISSEPAVKVKLDTIKDIRIQKLNKIKNI